MKFKIYSFRSFFLFSPFAFLLCFLFLSTSCSMISALKGDRNTVDDNVPTSSVPREVKWVSKAQYDDLQKKYQDLLKEKQDSSNANTNMMDGLDSSPQPSLAGESVDVFQEIAAQSKDQNKDKSKVGVVVAENSSRTLSITDLNSQILLFKKDSNDFYSGNREDVINKFTTYARSSVDQIRVRAKFILGRHYFEIKQYDLSLQMWDDILVHESFSSYVVDSLEFAVKCSQELGLQSKVQKFESLLMDVFQQGAV